MSFSGKIVDMYCWWRSEYLTMPQTEANCGRDGRSGQPSGKPSGSASTVSTSRARSAASPAITATPAIAANHEGSDGDQREGPSEEGNTPAMPPGAVLKEEGAVPPMPPGAFVKEEQVAPPMPPDAIVKREQQVVVKEEERSDDRGKRRRSK